MWTTRILENCTWDWYVFDKEYSGVERAVRFYSKVITSQVWAVERVGTLGIRAGIQVIRIAWNAIITAANDLARTHIGLVCVSSDMLIEIE